MNGLHSQIRFQKHSMSMYRMSVLQIWRNTEETEGKRIVSHYIRKNGDNFSKDEFLSSLESKYRSCISPYSLPISSLEQEY